MAAVSAYGDLTLISIIAAANSIQISPMSALGHKPTLAQRAITPVSKIQKDSTQAEPKEQKFFMAQPFQ
jgi:hypothetical protein